LHYWRKYGEYFKNNVKKLYGKRNLNLMFLALTDKKEISYLIGSLNKRKSAGIEDIPIRIIKS